ncbi:MAG: 16S rRNA (uracil(1498)-N(3))-methyltransferase [Cyanobacteriota bacterium]|nr:16S rRNA (uracil(1498)-N(3))-methyltransferase [Cyanobacteriota bacterium]
MVREQRRLLIAPHRLAPEVELTATEAHYLTRVLRLAAGQGCEVVDGEGRRWSALLEGKDRLRLEQPLAQPLEHQSAPSPALALAVALPRQDSELIWRMATELGIDRLQPLQAERCVGRGRWPQERWQAIVKEAVEQCERLHRPELAAPKEAQDWFASPMEGVKLLASSRGTDRPLLPHWLEKMPSPSAESVWVAIGPEGGWTPGEEEAAQSQGWILVSAGPTILRTSTAAVAVAAWLAGWRSQLSSSSDPGRSP